MSLEIKTNGGKLFGITDCEEEFVVVNNKKVLLHDVYASESLMDEFNDEIKNSASEIEDATK